MLQKKIDRSSLHSPLPTLARGEQHTAVVRSSPPTHPPSIVGSPHRVYKAPGKGCSRTGHRAWFVDACVVWLRFLLF